jgi:hypothetical protein
LLRSGDGEVVILRGATFFASRVINSLDSPEFFAVNLWGFDLLSHQTSRGKVSAKRKRPTSAAVCRKVETQAESAGEQGKILGNEEWRRS